MQRIVVRIAAGLVTLAVFLYAAYEFSPWPRALIVRYAFEKDAARIKAAQEKFVPPGIVSRLNERYDLSDGDALLDIYSPSPSKVDPALPIVVWVHGGGWVSGSKDEIANYLKILAGRGFTTVSVGYSLAPGVTYPAPVRQLNAALAYLVKNSGGLRINASNIVLAGDSAGAQITSQFANIVSSPNYARAVGIVPSIEPEKLGGILLFCGPYTTEGINLDGPFGAFLNTVLWSYSGSKKFVTDPKFRQAWILDHVTAQFPPAFISVGNADPLMPQSVALAKKLSALGVRAETLFFPADYHPPLQHEYQFDLDSEAGKLAMERAVAFLLSLKR